MKLDLTGIILSGGKSTRMGEDKAFIQIEGVPIIQRIYALFERLFKEIIIVTNQKEVFSNLDAKIYSDLLPNRGALGGLYTGLFFSQFRYVFCVGCDMPFIKESVVQFLVNRIEGYDVIVPKTNDGLEPLHAIYSKNCLEPIKRIIEDDKHRIIDLYPLVRVKIIEEDEYSFLDPTNESFVNVNTPEELESVKRR